MKAMTRRKVNNSIKLSMLRNKILVKASMMEAKYRFKALKLAASLPGVMDASLQGDDNSMIEIKGDGIDVVKLVKLLRKRIGYAEVCSNVGGESTVASTSGVASERTVGREKGILSKYRRLKI